MFSVRGERSGNTFIVPLDELLLHTSPSHKRLITYYAPARAPGEVGSLAIRAKYLEP